MLSKIFPFILTIIDFTLFSIFQRWICSSLLVFFVVQILKPQQQQRYHQNKFITPEIAISLLLLLIEDFFTNSRFGIGLIYLFPMIFIGHKIRPMLMTGRNVAQYIFVFCATILDLLLIKRGILGIKTTFASTLLILSCNLLLTSGTWGNRS